MPADFLDSNILIYLASADERKADRAERLLADGGTVSIQVLNEIANVSRRKLDLEWDHLHAFLETLRSLLTVEPVTIETHRTGLIVSERYRLSIYDGMIVAAALLAGCDTLWTEDMQHGLVIDDRLRLLNPFLLN